MTEKDIIVALEFGSSSIRGIAGRRDANGIVSILDIETEKAADSVRKGIIYNIDKTTAAIRNIIGRLNDKLDVNVTRAYVGITGQSLHSVRNFVSRQLETKVKITNDLVDALMDSNRTTTYTDSEILDVVPQEYVIGTRNVIDPIGVQSDHIEAHFLNIVARTTILDNVRKCMRLAGLDIVDTFISPMILADSMLSNNEKISGCALVDMGADTTTVSVYYENILRHIVVIPLGGNNITYDIAISQQMEHEESENIKRKHGIAYVPSDSDSPHIYPISNDRTLNDNDLQNIISARQQEIIENVWEQIKSESNHLLSGIIITGGASQLKDITEAFKHHTEFDKVKIAKTLIPSVDVAPGVTTPQGNSIDTLIALLMHGTEVCISDKPIEPVIEEEEEVVTIPSVEETKEEEIAPSTDETVEDKKKPKKDFGKKFFNWLKEMTTEE